MAGTETEGNVRRAVDRDTRDQYVVITLTASLSTTLSNFENSLLTSELWDWETVHEEPRQGFSHRKFSILPSWKGAVCGANSDPDYDYVSLKDGSCRSGSSSGKL
jgi:hypothetical protein